MLRRLATLITLALMAVPVTSTATANAAVPSTATANAVNCSAPLPQGDEPVTLDAADFVATIDNPYWPMTPGSRWVWREAIGGGVPGATVVVTVKTRTKEILGITATVVHDKVTEDGAVIEDTYDWYAQDTCGTIWYLGENTKEFEDGKVVSTEGSWESGVDGALPGVIVPADPQIGIDYRQEHYAGHAEDVGRTLSLDEQVHVPYGYLDGVMMTRETTPLSPHLLEYKFFARGVGPVLAIGVSGGSDREELVSFRAG